MVCGTCVRCRRTSDDGRSVRSCLCAMRSSYFRKIGDASAVEFAKAMATHPALPEVCVASYSNGRSEDGHLRGFAASTLHSSIWLATRSANRCCGTCEGTGSQSQTRHGRNGWSTSSSCGEDEDMPPVLLVKGPYNLTSHYGCERFIELVGRLFYAAVFLCAAQPTQHQQDWRQGASERKGAGGQPHADHGLIVRLLFIDLPHTTMQQLLSTAIPRDSTLIPRRTGAPLPTATHSNHSIT